MNSETTKDLLLSQNFESTSTFPVRELPFGLWMPSNDSLDSSRVSPLSKNLHVRHAYT
ncbi:uncharacterized protein STEHIDRAFT_126137 [Stereum hirsutum FP-91666 SS1]|uniref:Uncharacterized protein n=1 Tax=Stereum hirsutum (strain FP-91666) TaxID=721885 RepID=R7RXT1_STEHR|nr:uncharacterized protein STEHIDRAFT_126137 [Stereum hirsutum FP-91666 SS1]EIM80144.1 hypothetical protein STEHIDRAFT_126137 [Stereum hirsutum FP-91666 SS1]